MQLLSLLKEMSLHPKNAEELKGLILQLAVQGKLTSKWRAENPRTEPASEILKRIEAEKKNLIADKKIKKEKPLPPFSEDEIPYQLPNGWKWCRLRDVGYTMTGGTPSKSNPAFFGNDIPFIKPGDINDWKVSYDNEGLSFEGKKSLNRVAPQNSILMVCLGTIGKCAIIDKDCCFNQQINSITPLEVEAEYLLITLSSKYFSEKAWSLSTSTTIALLNKGKWEAILIPIPPIEEQKAIVEVVSQLFKEVEQLEELTKERIAVKEDFVISALNALSTSENTSTEWEFLKGQFSTFFTETSSVKKLRETILQLAVQGKITTKWRAENPNTEPASELLKRIEAEKQKLIADKKIKKEKPLPPISEDELTFELPEDWEWVRLGNIIKISSGDGLTSRNMDKDGKIPVYGGNGITGYHSKGNVSKPEIVIGRVGYYCGSIHLTEELAWVTDNAFITHFSEKNIYRDYLIWLLKGTNLKENENATAQPVISGKKVYPLVVCLPPFEEQKAIVQKINSLMTLFDELEQQIETSQTQIEQLMQSCLKEVFENKNEAIKA